MKQNFKTGDLVITNNFTLKQDVYRVKDGKLKNIGRYTKDELFNVLNNFIKSDKLYDKGVTIHIPKNIQIPNDFNYNSMIKNY